MIAEDGYRDAMEDKDCATNLAKDLDEDLVKIRGVNFTTDLAVDLTNAKENHTTNNLIF